MSSGEPGRNRHLSYHGPNVRTVSATEGRAAMNGQQNRPKTKPPASSAMTKSTSQDTHTSAVLRRDGFNLVGYLSREMSLGHVARSLALAAESAKIPVAKISYEQAQSPLTAGHPPGGTMQFQTTLAVVTALEFPLLVETLPQVFAASRRMIGYWFWELEHVPPEMISALDLVDEIWAGSRFVADAFTAVTDKPVCKLDIRVPEPTCSERERISFGPLKGTAGHFMFLVVFDHFSVVERKNPVGVIEAFKEAFEPGEGPVLVIKSINGSARPKYQGQVEKAANGRPDIIVWDEFLARPDQMALVRAADCLVSLHRSEGLGLHLAEAMWLGTPTIATAYSGNLDFMDPSCSLLVRAGRTNVVDGQGAYPSAAMWADPDLREAASYMRQIASDPDLARALASAGRTKMEAELLKNTGEQMRDLLGLCT
jgi:glycosyltransferase involved in cell wall biosynthesis